MTHAMCWRNEFPRPWRCRASVVLSVPRPQEWGWTSLHKAAAFGKYKHVVALLDAGAEAHGVTANDPSVRCCYCHQDTLIAQSPGF